MKQILSRKRIVNLFLLFYVIERIDEHYLIAFEILFKCDKI
jgi:hypothetical protein